MIKLMNLIEKLSGALLWTLVVFAHPVWVCVFVLFFLPVLLSR